jgi:hypothetical protein
MVKIIFVMHIPTIAQHTEQYFEGPCIPFRDMPTRDWIFPAKSAGFLMQLFFNTAFKINATRHSGSWSMLTTRSADTITRTAIDDNQPDIVEVLAKRPAAGVPERQNCRCQHASSVASRLDSLLRVCMPDAFASSAVVANLMVVLP